MGYIIAAMSAAMSVLLVVLGIQSSQSRRHKEKAVREAFKAREFEKNAQALTAHQEQVNEIKNKKDAQNAKVRKGNADDALADIIASNNQRVHERQGS